MRTKIVLDAATLASIDRKLTETDRSLAGRHTGDDLRRQPVHTVYASAGRYTSSLPGEWGDQALELVQEHGGMIALAGSVAGGPLDEIETLAERVSDKLEREPIEDLRIDFEDGYGTPGDAEEDGDALRAAAELSTAVAEGKAPASFGIRFKSLEQATRRRGLRTLDLFLGALLENTGHLPEGFLVTLPKVSTADQVAAMADVCTALEVGHSLPVGSLRFEVQVETSQVILDAAGTAPVARLVDAADKRLVGLHFGTYDYSAALGIAAESQSLDHPAADHAKHMMQLAVAGTGVDLSDGSTNIVPVGAGEQVRQAWLLHARLVRRSLERGYYQGWDLHPGHLPTRYLSTYAFYRAALPGAAARVRGYLARAEEGGFLDEPATLRALADVLLRGLRCGAVSEQEITGLPVADLLVHARPSAHAHNPTPAR